MSKFKCENCCKITNTADGHWQCKQCEYDICTVCRPRNHGNITRRKTDKTITVVKCNNDHDMNFTASNDGSLYLCDKCGKAYFSVVPRWRCDACELDLCKDCMAPPLGFKFDGELPYIKN